MHEVDRVVRGSELYLNRQQFVESAIREKVERVGFSAGGNPGFAGFCQGLKAFVGTGMTVFWVVLERLFFCIL